MLIKADTLGETIYKEGLNNYLVNLGDGFNVSAQLFPCANCHGRWGKGSQEGGVVAPNITWSQLSKPYNIATTNGRYRAAYNHESFTRVIRTGIDSAGQNLATIMPRYNYTEAQIKALLKTLKQLSKQSVIGVESDTIKIGLVLGQLQQRDLIIKLMQSYFQQINLNGGIFQRKIHLILDNTSGFKADCCLAMLSYSEDMFPVWASSLTRINVFSSSFKELKKSNYPSFSLYFGEQARQKWLKKYQHDNKLTKVWEIKPPSFEMTTQRGKTEYLKIAQQAKVTTKGLAQQLWLLSAGKLLVHALNESGRNIDTKKLTMKISNIHDFHTHFGPSLSYGAQHFIGASGGMIREVGSLDNWSWIRDYD